MINIEKNAKKVNSGKMELFSDRLVISSEKQTNVFYLSSITGFSISKMMTIFFSTNNGEYYEIKSDSIRTGVGYLILYRYLTGRDYV